MAVHIDISAFRSSIPAEITAAADRLLQDGGVDDLEASGGGAQAVVSDGGVRFQPWVGVVDRAFSGDCDCGMQADDDGFCAHAVAVALAAFEAGVKFSASSQPHEHSDYLEAVRRLGPQQLNDLVVEHAARDHLFAALLLDRAGLRL